MTRDEVETHEKAILFGIVTAAHIAKQLDWPLKEFLRAVLLCWDHELAKPKPRTAPAPSPEKG